MEATARLEYYLNEEGRKKSILAGGNGKRFQEIVTKATPEILELALVEEDGLVRFPADCNTRLVVVKTSEKPGWCWDGCGVTEFSEPQTVDSLVAHMKEVCRDIGRIKIDPVNLAEIALLEKEYKEEQEVENSRKAKEEAARITSRAEKTAWIEEHGSNHLRRATALGYSCQGLYVKERAAMEFPGFYVDLDEHTKWKSRGWPSPETITMQLDLQAKGYLVEVVWLTRPPKDASEYPYKIYEKGFNPCEALVVKEYLGKHTLVTIF
ncbi:hypothetical protein ACOBQJ_03530 [Pelotomaculum propionicicum]|uniref:hypothetical protein n=1 Tax=Pelotomaculum propionicicum TaxID=258475 RepID=UPI003B7D7EB4